MRKLKFFLCALFFAAVTATLLCVSTSASNNVTDMNVDVVLADNGDAYITQVWQGSFYEKTENYISINKSGYLTVSDFTASDESYIYDNIDWNINASFNDKAYSCGVVEYGDKYELCWGISEYGEHTYTVSYRVSGVVGAYSDSDGFNFRFINDQMSVFPSNARVTISLENGTPITDDNCNIWAFGYDGDISFQEGMVLARTNTPLNSNNHVTVMLQLNKGVIAPARSVDDSFQSVIDTAKKGSSYGDNDSNYTWEFDSASDWFVLTVMVLVIGGTLALFVVIITKGIMTLVRNRKFYKEANYFRDVPNGGNLPVTYKLGSMFAQCEETGVIGALILGLVNSGSLAPQTEEKTGMFGRTKEKINFVIDSIKQPDGYLERTLLELFREAAGDDGILQENELKRICRAQPERLRGIINSTAEIGQNYLEQHDCFVNNRIKANITKLTENGKKELSEAIGLKKFLVDFSLINERGVNEATIWKDYLKYAVLYGVADKVVEQLKIDLPEQLDMIEMYQANIFFAMHYSTFATQTMSQAEAARNAGSGGGASFGGGGGFSGGGSGGGSR